jgi:hypothetical protein
MAGRFRANLLIRGVFLMPAGITGYHVFNASKIVKYGFDTPKTSGRKRSCL